MQLSLQQINDGMTVYLYNDDEPPTRLIIVDKSDPHNIHASGDGNPLNGNASDTALLCLVPGCEMYRPIFDNAEEAALPKNSYKEQDGYTVQHGCWNCAKMFLWYDYDSGSECYCDRDGDRPPCNSSAIGEIKVSTAVLHEKQEAAKEAGTVIDIKEVLKEARRVEEYQFAEWLRWADTHQVFSAGICGKWEHQKAKDPSESADNS